MAKDYNVFDVPDAKNKSFIRRCVVTYPEMELVQFSPHARSLGPVSAKFPLSPPFLAVLGSVQQIKVWFDIWLINAFVDYVIAMKELKYFSLDNIRKHKNIIHIHINYKFSECKNFT